MLQAKRPRNPERSTDRRSELDAVASAKYSTYVTSVSCALGRTIRGTEFSTVFGIAGSVVGTVTCTVDGADCKPNSLELLRWDLYGTSGCVA